MGTIYGWSVTANNNGNSDSDINWLDGQNPDTVNNSAREMMRKHAIWLGDATIASAATVDLSTTDAAVVNITGTTAITALGTLKSGATKTLIFSGALTLTHNATSLIVPGAANITTAAGDTATAVSLGSGNWRVTDYTRADGSIILSADLDLNSNDITGTGNISIVGDGTIASLVTSGADAPNLKLKHEFSGIASTNYPSGALDFSVKPSASAEVTLGRVALKVISDTSGAENVQLEFYGWVSGSLSRVFYISGNDVVFNGGIYSSIDASDDIGTSSLRWKDLYLSGVATVGDIDTASTTTRGVSLNTGAVVAMQIQALSTVTGGNAIFKFWRGSTTEMLIRGDGDLENTNNAYGAISDARLKSGIETANSQWDDIKAFRLVNYTLDKYADEEGVFKEREEKPRHLGLSAQEAETVSPGLVKTDDTGVKSVTYSLLYLKAVGALQEAMKRIEALEDKVEKLGKQR